MTSSGVKVQQPPYVSTLKKYSQYTSSIYWNGTIGMINACFDKDNIVFVMATVPQETIITMASR